jgi:hypothetical protein
MPDSSERGGKRATRDFDHAIPFSLQIVSPVPLFPHVSRVSRRKNP